jgi:putative mRNA 3-end processing factor
MKRVQFFSTWAQKFILRPVKSNFIFTFMIEFNKGIHIKGTGLWLDAPRKADFCFVSHAHADHAVKHTRILATPETARLFEHRYGKAKFHILPYNRPKRFGKTKVELFPSGHILGGAQISIEKDGIRIVYTGDFKLRSSLTAKKAQVKKCDILIMESTFGRPHYIFPTPRRVQSQMIEFVEDAIARGKTPILLAYSLGKAQEAMKILSRRGYALCVHEKIHQIAKIYEEFGVKFKDYLPYRGEALQNRVLIIPPQSKRSRIIESIRRKRTAILTGWAMDGRWGFFSGADEAIPLSDHADFSELLEYVRKAKPEKIYTVHGFAEFIRYLKEEGFDAEQLNEDTKFDLSFSKEVLTNYDLFA